MCVRLVDRGDQGQHALEALQTRSLGGDAGAVSADRLQPAARRRDLVVELAPFAGAQSLFTDVLAGRLEALQRLVEAPVFRRARGENFGSLLVEPPLKLAVAA